VTHDALTLTAYFGERDAADGGMLADALMAAYARRGMRASLLLRGSAGFGVKHHLRTDRLLTLSEDLPLVAMATDAPAAILAAAEETVQHAGGHHEMVGCGSNADHRRQRHHRAAPRDFA